MVGIASQLSRAKLEETGEATSRSGRLPSKENSTNTLRNNREFMNGARTPSLFGHGSIRGAAVYQILARICRSGMGRKEREREKKSRSPGVRSWLAHCRCRADRKISRKFGAHHGNQSITTSSSKSTSRASRTFPLPCIQLLPDFQCYPFRGCIRQGTEGLGGKKSSIIDLMKFGRTVSSVKKLRVLLGATRCCIAETRFPAR